MPYGGKFTKDNLCHWYCESMSRIDEYWCIGPVGHTDREVTVGFTKIVFSHNTRSWKCCHFCIAS